MGGRAAAMWPGLCSAPLAPALRTARKRLPPLAAHTLGVNSERYLNVTGPVAVITGAASGIGAACAERFRHDGWRIAAIDLHDSDADLAVTADVRDRAAVTEAVDEAAARFGRIDLAVTAAGYYEEGIDVADISHDQWDRMLAVILGGTVNTFAAVLPHMLARGEGSIVAISSELALAGSATDLHYVAAKGAVLGFIKSLAMEVAQTAIRVNAVAPGPTGQARGDRGRGVLPGHGGVCILRRSPLTERWGGDLTWLARPTAAAAT